MGRDTQDIQLVMKRLKLYEAIVSKSQNGVLVFNDQMQVIFSNQTASKILGEQAAGLRGKSISEFIPPDIRAKHEKLVTHFRISKDYQQELPDWRRIECCRANGEAFPASITIEKITVSTSNVYIVFLNDMTDMVEMEKQSCQRELELFQARQQKKYSADTLQLKLQKNITQIAMSARSIKETYDLDPINVAMSNILTFAFSTLSLSQQVIYISGVSENNHKLQLVDNSLKGLLHRLQSTMEHQAAERGNTIELNVPTIAEKLDLQSDLTIEQILLNVIEDLIYNTSDSHIEITIPRIERGNKKQIKIEFQLKTSSYSNPCDLVNQLLNDPAKSTLSENNLYKDGLCLKLAKHLTETLGGEMQVSSNPGQEVEIDIRLKTKILKKTQSHQNHPPPQQDKPLLEADAADMALPESEEAQNVA